MVLQSPQKLLVTTPIYYLNSTPHIGHAYTSIIADILARSYFMQGKEVKFTTGVDEHGTKVLQAAKKKNISPQEYCDNMSTHFKKMCHDLNLSDHIFIRTTNKTHREYVQQAWLQLESKGMIYPGQYSGWYATNEETFYSATNLVKNQEGKKVTPYGNEVEWIKEQSFFLKTSIWKNTLLEYYRQNPDFVVPKQYYNEMLNLIPNMEDLSCSRTSNIWGISVPSKSEQTIYVWFDALMSYLSADKTTGNSFWPPHKQIVGKDIAKFHAIHWPCILLSLGLKLPQQIAVHGWWLTDTDQKISKSKENSPTISQLLEIVDGSDTLRYYLVRAMSFGNDGHLNTETAKKIINKELVNGLGNLVNRVLTLVSQNYGPHIPQYKEISPSDKKLLDITYGIQQKIENHINNMQIHKMLNEIMTVQNETNQYINIQEPWKMEQDKERLATILYCLLEVIRCLSIYLHPILPTKTKKIFHMFGINGAVYSADIQNKKLTPQTTLNPIPPLFAKLK